MADGVTGEYVLVESVKTALDNGGDLADALWRLFISRAVRELDKARWGLKTIPKLRNN
jgi:hypothetical protein